MFCNNKLCCVCDLVLTEVCENVQAYERASNSSDYYRHEYKNNVQERSFFWKGKAACVGFFAPFLVQMNVNKYGGLLKQAV